MYYGSDGLKSISILDAYARKLQLGARAANREVLVLAWEQRDLVRSGKKRAIAKLSFQYIQSFTTCQTVLILA